jgi:hypothetical protein
LRQMQMLSHHHPPKKSPLSGRWTHHDRGNNNTVLLASLPNLEATKGPQSFEAEKDLDSITVSHACDDGLAPMVGKHTIETSLAQEWPETQNSMKRCLGSTPSLFP